MNTASSVPFSVAQPSAARAWLMAIRPKTLWATVSPVLVGSAIAARVGEFDPAPGLATLACALLLQISSNLANDVFDHERGADAPGRLGPPRATSSGLLAARDVKRAVALCLAVAVVLGAYLVAVAGPTILLIGLASVVGALAYTGGPWPLAYNGLGDVAAFLFYGVLAVLGTVVIHMGAIVPLALACAIPVAALVTALLVVNNVRDTDTDRAVGKMTIPARFGRRVGQVEYSALLAVAYLAPVALVAITGSGWLALPILSLPLAVRLHQTVWRRSDGPSLNRALAGTAQLELIFCILLSAGLLLP